MSIERQGEITAVQKLKVNDPWMVIINEDLSKFEQENMAKFNSKRNSQASYKDYLERQMEQSKV